MIGLDVFPKRKSFPMIGLDVFPKRKRFPTISLDVFPKGKRFPTISLDVFPKRKSFPTVDLDLFPKSKKAADECFHRYSRNRKPVINRNTLLFPGDFEAPKEENRKCIGTNLRTTMLLTIY
ncbi:MAG: hypothetical protein A2W90_10415 [Bacteroidetes bacterium GWF2_42_66]|nr:MAG: hypothetical protein A2W92_24110 [Bacteroidetes bacterium GWA2_42_15]OFY43323.1 MAG: hypothetical protein A2W90_10415 [Bacteroidetes bacterium GWF2_42_66]HCU61723.1 hypothetical protein [Prolixibacteraceae bacterium]